MPEFQICKHILNEQNYNDFNSSSPQLIRFLTRLRLLSERALEECRRALTLQLTVYNTQLQIYTLQLSSSSSSHSVDISSHQQDFVKPTLNKRKNDISISHVKMDKRYQVGKRMISLQPLLSNLMEYQNTTFQRLHELLNGDLMNAYQELVNLRDIVMQQCLPSASNDNDPMKLTLVEKSKKNKNKDTKKATDSKERQKQRNLLIQQQCNFMKLQWVDYVCCLLESYISTWTAYIKSQKSIQAFVKSNKQSCEGSDSSNGMVAEFPGQMLYDSLYADMMTNGLLLLERTFLQLRQYYKI